MGPPSRSSRAIDCSTTVSVCSYTSLWWWCSSISRRNFGISGKNFSQSPVSTKVVIPARGSLDITVLMNSSLIRSAEIIESRSAIDFIATRTSSSIVNPSCAAKRAARNIRSGSSEKESSGELGVRNTRFKRSVTPL